MSDCPYRFGVAESLWTWNLDELRRRTASSAPTPGGGSIAAVTATMGVSLLLMAVDVTLDSARGAPDATRELRSHRDRLQVLADQLAAAADADISAFQTLICAYRLPRTTAGQQQQRRATVQSASRQAAQVPLALAQTCAEAAGAAPVLAELVLENIASDVLAGRDLLIGAARAALHTVAVNLPPLEADEAEGYRTLVAEVQVALGVTAAPDLLRVPDPPAGG